METFVIVIRYIFSVIAVCGAGYALLLFLECAFRGGKEGFLNGWQRASLSFLVGSGLLSVYLFIIGLFGVRYSLFTFIPFFVVVALLGIWAAVRGVTPFRFRDAFAPFRLRSWPWWQRVAFAIVVCFTVLHLGFFVFQAVFVPTYFDDGVHTWNIRAKHLFEYKGLFLGEDTGGLLESFQMKGYPLFSTLAKVYFASASGGFFESVTNLFGVLTVFSAVLFLFFTLLSHTKNYLASILISYGIVSIPLASMHVASGYVDVLFGMLILASTVFLFLWLTSEKKMFYLVGAVMMLGLAGFMKQNPLPIFLIPFAGVVLASSLRDLKQFAGILFLMIIGLGVLVGPWLLFRGIYPWEIAGSAHLENYTNQLPTLAHVLFAEGNYNIFFFGFFVFLVTLAWKKFRTRHIFLAGYVLAAFLLLLGTFFFTQYGRFLQDQTTFNRAMLMVLPSLIFVVGIVVYDWLQIEKIAVEEIAAKRKRK